MDRLELHAYVPDCMNQGDCLVCGHLPSAPIHNIRRKTMDFGDAIRALKGGEKVARAGWNGKGMWLVLVPGRTNAFLDEGTPYRKALDKAQCDILPHIDMWTTNSEGRRAMLPGWLASQTDMLSEDWEVVP